MRSTSLSLLALLASFAVAQNSTMNGTDYATGLLAALGAVGGLTTLSAAIQALPPSILPVLMSGNFTVLAPSDAAFATSLNVTGPQDIPNVPADVLTNTILYHVLQGAFPPSAFSNGTLTLARSLLSNTSYVQLGGRNLTQAVLLQRTAPSNVSILQTSQTPVAYANATYRNLNVYVIDQVLAIPGSLPTVASQLAPALVSALGLFPGLTDSLAAIRGITVFAPQDAVLNAALPTLQSLNQTAATAVLANHVLNGTVAYSPLLTNNMTVISASGQPLRITVNSTGVFVSTANIIARVVRPNVLTSNGVIHVIDQVLVNTASNPQAAASAASVAAQASATVAPGPVNSASAAASASASARPSSAASTVQLSSFLLVAGGLVAGASALFL